MNPITATVYVEAVERSKASYLRRDEPENVVCVLESEYATSGGPRLMLHYLTPDTPRLVLAFRGGARGIEPGDRLLVSFEVLPAEAGQTTADELPF